MAFKKVVTDTLSVTTIEALFRDLRNRKVEGLIAHQADTLRRYENEAINLPDVALELPTGSGKTLIGLLIAEYRRRKFSERVVYVCPTNQLVHQAASESKPKYGIGSTAFVGKQSQYAPTNRSNYANASTVAITNYSTIFNTNSFFSDAHTLIFDDAHAAENYIAKFWSVLIKRQDSSEFYKQVVALFSGAIPESQWLKMMSDTVDAADLSLVEKIPGPKLYSMAAELTALIDAWAPSFDEVKYPWSVIRDKLTNCSVYVNVAQVLIRPLIPPTMTHPPFEKARHRVYMSATLGRGGDLERTVGVSQIHRIPTQGWDKQGIGRRFFMFPGQSLDDDECTQLLFNLMERTSRTLILVPSDSAAEEIRKGITAKGGYALFDATDIENSKAVYVSTDKAVAVLANRYDGIDLVGDDCRLLMINGLPKAANLQERFLESRMAANTLLQDRIRTRLVQAIGRCTRSARDYASVVIWGDDFNDWLVHKEKRALLHPELQGELEFGLQQSTEVDRSTFIENYEIFLEHGDDWNEVNAQIVQLRESATQKAIPGEEKLLAAAKNEVRYQYKLWAEDYEGAIEECEGVLQHLSGPEVHGYRGFWCYLAGSAAFLAYKSLDDEVYKAKARDYFIKAHSCTKAVPWLLTLISKNELPASSQISLQDELLAANIEGIEIVLTKLASPKKFAEELRYISEGLNQGADADRFEEAHRRLGELLGYEAGNSSESASPDPWWVSGGKLCIVAEDKSDSNPGNPVPPKYARQAAGHPDWLIQFRPELKDMQFVPIMITTAKSIEKAASALCGDVLYWGIDDFRSWADAALAVIRKLRNKFTTAGDMLWRNDAAEELRQARLDPISLVEQLKSTKLRDLPKVG